MMTRLRIAVIFLAFVVLPMPVYFGESAHLPLSDLSNTRDNKEFYKCFTPAGTVYHVDGDFRAERDKFDAVYAALDDLDCTNDCPLKEAAKRYFNGTTHYKAMIEDLQLNFTHWACTASNSTEKLTLQCANLVNSCERRIWPPFWSAMKSMTFRSSIAMTWTQLLPESSFVNSLQKLSEMDNYLEEAADAFIQIQQAMFRNIDTRQAEKHCVIGRLLYVLTLVNRSTFSLGNSMTNEIIKIQEDLLRLMYELRFNNIPETRHCAFNPETVLEICAGIQSKFEDVCTST